MRSISSFLMSGVLMALAWSLRGQFGHLKGGMIVGAAAALIPLLFMRGRWLSSAGLALILGSLGFALGGHLSYGRLVEYAAASLLQDSLPHLLQIFLIGGVWGGLGGTFLGFGFSEKPFHRKDFLILTFVLTLWFVVLGIFNLDFLDRTLFYFGFAFLHLYNEWIKKSRVIFQYGAGGMFVFGTAFVAAVLMLKLGCPLRDQILGFLAGWGLWMITWNLEKNQIFPAALPNPIFFHRFGIIWIAVVIPGINTLNVIRHWIHFQTFSQIERLIAGILTVFFAALLGIYSKQKEFFSTGLKQTVMITALFFIWYLSMAAIAKDALFWGRKTWETAYTLFLVFSSLLTLFLLFKKGSAQETA